MIALLKNILTHPNITFKIENRLEVNKEYCWLHVNIGHDSENNQLEDSITFNILGIGDDWVEALYKAKQNLRKEIDDTIDIIYQEKTGQECHSLEKLKKRWFRKSKQIRKLTSVVWYYKGGDSTYSEYRVRFRKKIETENIQYNEALLIIKKDILSKLYKLKKELSF
jgi:hypothetical protein